MYLAQLSAEQKYAYMALARELASVDNAFSRDEQIMMARYRQEMGLASDGDLTAEQAIACFSAAHKGTRKKIMFELLALAYSDTSYDAAEERYLKKLLTAFDLSEEFLASARDVLSALNAVYIRMAALLDA